MKKITYFKVYLISGKETIRSIKIPELNVPNTIQDRNDGKSFHDVTGKVYTGKKLQACPLCVSSMKMANYVDPGSSLNGIGIYIKMLLTELFPTPHGQWLNTNRGTKVKTANAQTQGQTK